MKREELIDILGEPTHEDEGWEDEEEGEIIGLEGHVLSYECLLGEEIQFQVCRNGLDCAIVWRDEDFTGRTKWKWADISPSEGVGKVLISRKVGLRPTEVE